MAEENLSHCIIANNSCTTHPNHSLFIRADGISSTFCTYYHLKRSEETLAAFERRRLRLLEQAKEIEEVKIDTYNEIQYIQSQITRAQVQLQITEQLNRSGPGGNNWTVRVQQKEKTPNAFEVHLHFEAPGFNEFATTLPAWYNPTADSIHTPTADSITIGTTQVPLEFLWQILFIKLLDSDIEMNAGPAPKPERLPPWPPGLE